MSMRRLEDSILAEMIDRQLLVSVVWVLASGVMVCAALTSVNLFLFLVIPYLIGTYAMLRALQEVYEGIEAHDRDVDTPRTRPHRLEVLEKQG